MSTEQLQYHTLNKQEQLAYSLILRSLTAFADTIDISPVDKYVDVNKVFKTVVNDNPQFFYFNKSQITTLSSMSKRYLKLSGCLRKQQALKMMNEINGEAKPLVECAVKRSRDPYERLLYIYEHLQKRTAYDDEELRAASKGKVLNRNAHNIYGALVERKAVCDGFAAAFQFLVQSMGYVCTCVSGTSDHNLYGNVNHVWNVVRIDKNYYHIDLTWDTNHYADNKAYSYDWFLLDDDGILSDHTWDISTTPPAVDTSLMWHKLNGLLADNESEIAEIFAKAARKPNAPIYVRCTRNVWSAKPMGEYLAQLLVDTALRYRPEVEITYSWNVRTGCFFSRIIG